MDRGKGKGYIKYFKVWKVVIGFGYIEFFGGGGDSIFKRIERARGRGSAYLI